jgi:3',5'-cyclic AMP phosphodiesterase CpdA
VTPRRSATGTALLLAALLLSLSPSAARGWSFAAAGDSRNDARGIFPRILAAVEGSPMEFLLHTGDIEPEGGEAAWSAFRARTAAFGKPLRLVLGNHELYGRGSREGFARFFGLPGTNYAFTHRDTLFLVADNAGGSFPDGTLAWLDRELAESRGKGAVSHRIVAMHAPPATERISPHAMAPEYARQSARLREILERHGVEMVICGHEHVQFVEDWGKVRVVVTGGAGAPLVPLQRHGFFRIDVGKGTVKETFVPAEGR